VSDDLVEFLRARLLEDELAAAGTLPPALQIGRLRGKPVLHWKITESGRGVIDKDGGTLRARDIFPAEAAHAIRHDPARVLAEVEAKRQIVDLAAGMLAAAKGDSEVDHYGGLSAAEETLLLLARPFRDHPDFNPAWLED
jgi:hypothetical protein